MCLQVDLSRSKNLDDTDNAVEMGSSGIDIKTGGELRMSGGTTDLDTESFVVRDDEKEIISATPGGVVVGADYIVASKYLGPVLGTFDGESTRGKVRLRLRLARTACLNTLRRRLLSMCLRAYTTRT